PRPPPTARSARRPAGLSSRATWSPASAPTSAPRRSRAELQPNRRRSRSPRRCRPPRERRRRRSGGAGVEPRRAPSPHPTRPPPSGSGCPSSPRVDTRTGLETNSSSPAFTPVPANEIDTKGSGWIVARPTATPSTKLAIFKVTKDADSGRAKIQKTSTNISVDRYDIPPPAPQEGSSATLDTLDARFTQAVAGLDPNHKDKLAIWTQQTIAGG